MPNEILEEHSMYYIALNVLHNMNSSRIMLYREMKKYFENQNINSDDEVFELV